MCTLKVFMIITKQKKIKNWKKVSIYNSDANLKQWLIVFNIK